MPASFWDPPPPHDYPYLWFTSDPKSKEDKVKAINFNTAVVTEQTSEAFDENLIGFI